MVSVVVNQTLDCYLNSNGFVVVAAVELVNDDAELENHELMTLLVVAVE